MKDTMHCIAAVNLSYPIHIRFSVLYEHLENTIIDQDTISDSAFMVSFDAGTPELLSNLRREKDSMKSVIQISDFWSRVLYLRFTPFDYRSEIRSHYKDFALFFFHTLSNTFVKIKRIETRFYIYSMNILVIFSIYSSK